MHWMLLPLRRYADFSGRSRRMEFWMFSLFVSIIGLLLAMIGFAMSNISFTGDIVGDVSASSAFAGFLPLILFYIAIFVPSVAVQVRRFHDRDMSGWWVLGFSILSNIPVVGLFISVAWFVLLVLPGTYGDNRFGPDPKDPHLDIDQVFS